MEFEEMIKSKTIWAGALMIVLGLVSSIGGNIDPTSILTGLGFVGLRTAME